MAKSCGLVAESGELALDAATKTLKITMGTAGFTAETTYTFSLTWKLLAVKNDACSIKVSATGTNTFAEAAMTNVDGKVGKVDEPMFKTLKIGQYTTRPDTDNYVCVTLKTNYLFNSDHWLLLSKPHKHSLTLPPLKQMPHQMSEMKRK